MRLLKDYIRTIPYTDKDESTMFKGLLLLMDIAPAFISKIINEYIYAYTTGVIQNITPINIKKVRDVISNKIGVEREILEAFINSDPVEQEVVRNFFEVVK
jgi:hypothetical protein